MDVIAPLVADLKCLSENIPVRLEVGRISSRMGLLIVTVLQGDASLERA
jgi:hypothetical protein